MSGSVRMRAVWLRVDVACMTAQYSHTARTASAHSCKRGLPKQAEKHGRTRIAVEVATAMSATWQELLHQCRAAETAALSVGTWRWRCGWFRVEAGCGAGCPSSSASVRSTMMSCSAPSPVATHAGATSIPQFRGGAGAPEGCAEALTACWEISMPLRNIRREPAHRARQGAAICGEQAGIYIPACKESQGGSSRHAPGCCTEDGLARPGAAFISSATGSSASSTLTSCSKGHKVLSASGTRCTVC